jgi:hypothetical protein
MALSVTDPGAPAIAGALPTRVWATRPGRLSVANDHAFVPAGGLHAVDVRDPTVPRLVGSIDTPGAGTDLALAGGYAYLAEGLHYSDPTREEHPGLRLVDVSDPTDLRLVGALDTDWAQGVEVADGHAYLAVIHDRSGSAGGLRIVDVRDPGSAAQVGSIDFEAGARSVALSGRLALVATGEESGQILGPTAGAVHAFDVTDRSHPVLAQVLELPAAASDIVVHGGLAYVADTSGGLHVFDIEPEMQTVFLPVAGND